MGGGEIGLCGLVTSRGKVNFRLNNNNIGIYLKNYRHITNQLLFMISLQLKQLKKRFRYKEWVYN